MTTFQKLAAASHINIEKCDGDHTFIKNNVIGKKKAGAFAPA